MKMASKTVTMYWAKTTPGAVKYVEKDENDNVVEMRDALLGQMYIRKKLLDGKDVPSMISVTVEW
jgi:hypothetical protein